MVANRVCLGMSTDQPNRTTGRLGGMGMDMTDYSSCSIQRFGNFAWCSWSGVEGNRSVSELVPELAPVLAKRLPSRGNWSAGMGEVMGRGGCCNSWESGDGGWQVVAKSAF